MNSADKRLLTLNPKMYEFVCKCYRNIHFMHLCEDYIFEEPDKNDLILDDFDEVWHLVTKYRKLSHAGKNKFWQLYRIRKNRGMKKYRYNRLVKGWIKEGLQVVFITLTISDEHINKDFKTIRRYINNYLNDVCVDYIANDDYGKSTNRLHYHAIAILKDQSILKKSIIDKKHIQHYNLIGYNYGHSDAQMVIKGDAENVTAYINKLSQHALKSTAYSEHNVLRKRNKKKVAIE